MKISRDYLRKKSDASVESDSKIREADHSFAESDDNRNDKNDPVESMDAAKPGQPSRVITKRNLLKNKRKRDYEEFTIEENCLLDKLTKYLKFICTNFNENLVFSEKDTLERVITYFDKFQLPKPIETLKVRRYLSYN